MFNLPHIYRNVVSFQHQFTNWPIWVRIPAGTRRFSLIKTAHTSSGVHTTSYSMCTGVLFWRWNGRGVMLTPYFHLVSTLRISRCKRLLLVYDFVGRTN